MPVALLVPMALDALYLSTPQRVVDPSIDFTKLPFWDGRREVNPDTAYLSDELLAQPMHDRGFTLSPGVHLHWALPAALARSFHRHDPDPPHKLAFPADPGRPHKLSFPAVPNRWLVTRTCRDLARRRQWVVESDYVHPTYREGIGAAVALPFIVTPATAGVPYRLMGRTRVFDEHWQEDPQPDFLTTNRLRLTAVGLEPEDGNAKGGYADPAFAALYPNCHGIFGFHDPDPPADTSGYDVVGWYSRSEQECLNSEQFRTARDAVRKARAGSALDPEDADIDPEYVVFRKTLEQLQQWRVPNQGMIPERVLCVASLTFAADAEISLNEERPPAKVTVAVGNTATEALSAYIAATVKGAPGEWEPAQQELLQEQLEALHLAAHAHGKQIDVGAKLREAQHQKSFVGIDGGTVWTVRKQPTMPQPGAEIKPGTSDATANIESAGAKLPEHIATLLSRLNEAQRACERTARDIVSLQTLTYADWRRYMMCAYPPPGATAVHADIDEARHFIVTNDLVPLQRRQAMLELQGKQRDDLGNQLQDQLAALKPQAEPEWVLQSHPGPRYWQPRNPVLLAVGAALEPSERHAPREDSLKCEIFPLQEGSLKAWLDAVLEHLSKTDVRDDLLHSKVWQRQPWNPFALQWQLELLPLDGCTVGPSPDETYASDCITRRYRLDEFELASTQDGEPTRVAGVFDGSGPISDHAQRQLKRLLNELFHPTTEAHAALIRPDADTLSPDTLASMRSVLDAENYYAQAQSLAGFNEALLMQKQCMQLPVDEPLGSPHAREFTKSVAAALGKRHRTTPQSSLGFHPIRTGALNLVSLRLVDTFGRTQQLTWDPELILAKSLRVTDDKKLIGLPPRLSQPARLSFRWLSASPSHASSSGQEMNTHPTTTPICGWIVRPAVDEQLFVHAADGTLLGLLKIQDDRCVWTDAPGTLPVKIESIDDETLRDLVAGLSSLDASAFRDRLEHIDDSIENIHPEHFAQLSVPALMFGRPLAIARASLRLELQDRPATDLDWEIFRREIQHALDHERATLGPYARCTHDFEQVTWPVRLGMDHLLDDGLVGYWDAQSSVSAPASYAAEPLTSASPLLLPLNAKARTVTLLFDPRARVHATCGVLPGKSINIPASHFMPALETLSIAFRSGPLLAPAGPLQTALPAPDGYAWSFWTETEQSWLRRDVVSGKTASLGVPIEIVDGWFKLAKQ